MPSLALFCFEEGWVKMITALQYADEFSKQFEGTKQINYAALTIGASNMVDVFLRECDKEAQDAGISSRKDLKSLLKKYSDKWATFAGIINQRFYVDRDYGIDAKGFMTYFNTESSKLPPPKPKKSKLIIPFSGTKKD